MIFDTAQGTVAIGGKVLAADLSPSDVLSVGFVFEREIDMKTGWVFRNTSQDSLDGHTVVPALGFHGGKLKRVSISFLEEDASAPASLGQRHRQLLAQQLGTPNTTSMARVQYDFSWGQISAEEDVRNGTSYIIATWK